MKRYRKTAIMHRVVEHNSLLHFGGVVADDLTQDMAGQTAEICQKLEDLLSEAGSSKQKLLSATIFVTDMSRKQQMSDVWTSWLEQDDLPARATIGVADLGKNVLIEIIATAAK